MFDPDEEDELAAKDDAGQQRCPTESCRPAGAIDLNAADPRGS